MNIQGTFVKELLNGELKKIRLFDKILQKNLWPVTDNKTDSYPFLLSNGKNVCPIKAPYLDQYYFAFNTQNFPLTLEQCQKKTPSKKYSDKSPSQIKILTIW